VIVPRCRGALGRGVGKPFGFPLLFGVSNFSARRAHFFMRFNIFAIFDDKARAYMTPFFLPENGQAMRAFSDAVNDMSSPVSRHPADYTLFRIASFDDSTGIITAESPHATLANGVQLVKPYKGPMLPLGNGAADVPVSLRDG